MSKDQKTVDDTLSVLLARCSSPAELLSVLVPIAAAALAHVKAQPADVQAFFLRVTGLLDEFDAGQSHPTVPKKATS